MKRGEFMDDMIIRFVRNIRRVITLNHSEMPCGNFKQSEFITIAAIYGLSVKSGSVAMSVVAKELKVTPAMVSKTVGVLESKGLVQRVIDDSDRRGIKVCCTEKGNELYNINSAHAKEKLNMVFDEMGRENVAEMLRLSELFCDTIEAIKKRDKKGENSDVQDI